MSDLVECQPAWLVQWVSQRITRNHFIINIYLSDLIVISIRNPERFPGLVDGNVERTLEAGRPADATDAGGDDLHGKVKATLRYGMVN